MPGVKIPTIDAKGFRIEAADVVSEALPGGSYRFKVRLKVPDRQTGKTIVVVTDAEVDVEAVDHLGLPDLVHEVVRNAFIIALTHEVDEMLRVEGVPWKDPHRLDVEYVR